MPCKPKSEICLKDINGHCVEPFQIDPALNMTIVGGPYGSPADCANNNCCQLTSNPASCVYPTVYSGEFNCSGGAYSLPTDPGYNQYPDEQPNCNTLSYWSSIINIVQSAVSAQGWTIDGRVDCCDCQPGYNTLNEASSSILYYSCNGTVSPSEFDPDDLIVEYGNEQDLARWCGALYDTGVGNLQQMAN